MCLLGPVEKHNGRRFSSFHLLSSVNAGHVMSFSNKHPVDMVRLRVPNYLRRRALSATTRPSFLITSINSLAVIWEANLF